MGELVPASLFRCRPTSVMNDPGKLKGPNLDKHTSCDVLTFGGCFALAHHP